MLMQPVARWHMTHGQQPMLPAAVQAVNRPRPAVCQLGHIHVKPALVTVVPHVSHVATTSKMMVLPLIPVPMMVLGLCLVNPMILLKAFAVRMPPQEMASREDTERVSRVGKASRLVLVLLSFHQIPLLLEGRKRVSA